MNAPDTDRATLVVYAGTVAQPACRVKDYHRVGKFYQYSTYCNPMRCAIPMGFFRIRPGGSNLVACPMCFADFGSEAA